MGALIVKTFVLTKFILTCFQLESQSTAYYCYIIILCLQQPCKHELVLLLALSNSYRCECHPTHNQRHMLDHIKQALKAFIKPFEALQRNVKIKIYVNFFSLSGIGTGRIKYVWRFNGHQKLNSTSYVTGLSICGGSDSKSQHDIKIGIIHPDSAASQTNVKVSLSLPLSWNVFFFFPLSHIFMLYHIY